MNKQVVLFGGSFDPPHLGHLIVGQWVAETLCCPVRFLPNGNPPHKSPSSHKHRAAMLRLAISGNENFLLDESELDTNATQYTVKTLDRYRNHWNLTRDKLFFVLGSDSLNSIQSWRDPQGIIERCTLMVFQRQPISSLVVQYLSSLQARYILSAAPVLDISSTFVRERVKQGLSIQYYVPETVREYISQWKLYKEGKV